MKRRIIEINEEKCNGCGACAKACHEGAISMVNGKAKLMRDDYCDGLGDCLPKCPTGAITFVVREADAYNHLAVMENKVKNNKISNPCITAGCPGIKAQKIEKYSLENEVSEYAPSRLSQWPVQIKLAPIKAPYFDNGDLLIAADCTAFSYGAFHEKFIKNHITLIGCPKLDDVDYSEKLAEIIKNNNIKSIDMVRMEVPCCRGIELAVKKAVEKSRKNIPINISIISIKGEIIN